MPEWREPGERSAGDSSGEDRVDDDPAAPVQLGLFTPELAEAEAAFQALDRLELDRAVELFRGILARDPSDRDAAEGLAAVAHWRRQLASSAELAPLARADALWLAVAQCPPRLITRKLRHRLLREVLELLETGDPRQATPTVCAGEVLLALGQADAARSWLEWAIRREPNAARFQLLRGDVLWAEDAVGAARSCYSRGLLLDPTLDRWRAVAWSELARSISRGGGAATALEWWATARLPLPPLDAVGTPHPTIAGAWRALAEAEAARAGGRFDDLLRARSQLRERSPVLFELYMARLEGS